MFHFYTLLIVSENLEFSNVFRGYWKGILVENVLIQSTSIAWAMILVITDVICIQNERHYKIVDAARIFLPSQKGYSVSCFSVILIYVSVSDQTEIKVVPSSFL